MMAAGGAPETLVRYLQDQAASPPTKQQTLKVLLSNLHKEELRNFNSLPKEGSKSRRMICVGRAQIVNERDHD